MLNEYKKQMWNDGPAKQPWLDYFNEYERTHCCFGDADKDAPSVGEEALEQNFGYTVEEQRADDEAARRAAIAGPIPDFTVEAREEDDREILSKKLMEKGEKGSEGYVNPNISLPPSLDPRKDEIIITRLGPAEPNFGEKRRTPIAPVFRNPVPQIPPVKSLYTKPQDLEKRRQAGLEDLIRGRQMSAAEERKLVDEALARRRAKGGMVYRATSGQVEEKPKSAMELYLEKLGRPSKYTVPVVPMQTPSMTPAPTSSDPFELADYRKNLARETMGSYLPFDPSGASDAINTFNEAYYGGAGNVNPYSVAQLASLYGLDRDPATYEGIIGMLGGVRNEAPLPPVVSDPVPEPDIPIMADDSDDDNYSMYDEEEEEFGGIGSIDDEETTVETESDYDDDGTDDYAQGGRISDVLYRQTGGGIRDVLYRQTGGAANPQMGMAMPGGVFNQLLPNATSIVPDPRDRRRPPIFPRPPGQMPLPYPDPSRPEPKPIMPPLPEPPPPPPEPKIIYDPEREAAARKAAEQLQARRVAELGTSPQTRAEREALQAKGGFYRDDEGQVRDAEGNLQEDWGFDYVAPPEPDPVPEPPPPTDPIPLPPVMPDPFPRPEYNPFTDYTGPKTMADLGNIGRGGSYFTPEFTQYLEGQGYTIDMTPTYIDKGPQIINQQGQPVTFNELYNPTMIPPAGVQGLGPSSTIGPQLQPTGLQGLQQNMQGFGMQSPRPFGTQQPFSSGFGGFGQQQGYYR